MIKCYKLYVLQESVRSFIKLKPDYADAHYNPGLAYLQIGEENSALEEQ